MASTVAILELIKKLRATALRQRKALEATEAQINELEKASK